MSDTNLEKKVDKKRKKVVLPLSQAESATQAGDPEELIEVLSEELARKGPHSRALTLMILEIDDLDGFQKVFGPERCRKLLEEVAVIIEQSLRSGDIVASYDKQKFGLILKGAGPKVASGVGNRIRRAIKEAAFAPEYGHVLKITVSGGYASQTDEVFYKSSKDLVKAAAGYLCLAREGGQDQITGKSASSAPLDFPGMKARE